MKKVHINMCPILDLPHIPPKCRDNGNCTFCSWLKLATKLAECMTPPAGSIGRGSHEGVYGN